MMGLFIAGIMVGLAGLLAYEAFQEARGSSEELHDHYHE
jgi:hypothetical protein